MSRNSFPYKIDFTRVQNVTTLGTSVTAPKAVGPQAYGVQLSATQNTWVNFADPVAGASAASASQTVATPGVFTTVVQAYVAGTPVYLTGIAPGGFALNQIYYIIATGLTTTAVQLSDTAAGTGKQVTASAVCVINPVGQATATNGVLLKLTDTPVQLGISPGQWISTLQVTTTGTVNIVELTH